MDEAKVLLFRMVGGPVVVVSVDFSFPHSQCQLMMEVSTRMLISNNNSQLVDKMWNDEVVTLGSQVMAELARGIIKTIGVIRTKTNNPMRL
jgi:hypothetical protein